MSENNPFHQLEADLSIILATHEDSRTIIVHEMLFFLLLTFQVY